MVKYDLLVYLGFIPVFATIIVAAFVIWAIPVDVDPEVRKIRVADATLVGLLALFVFTASLHYNDPALPACTMSRSGVGTDALCDVKQYDL
jgi:hypothetical protein